MEEKILEVKNLKVSIENKNEKFNIINDVSFSLAKGEILGIVGESGSGKSVTVYSILGLMSKGAKISGEVIFNGKDLLKLSKNELNSIRGKNISMIYQDPMTSLNPVYTIGFQISEVLKIHHISCVNYKNRVMQLLEEVGINDAEKRYYQYPHELSGGMRQRVVIAMALASEPDILIADEPTTALDVTVQAQILELFKKIIENRNMSVILITHDLGVVVEMCNTIIVMYAGRICERGTVEDIFKNAKHEYTKGLLSALPQKDVTKPLTPIEGNPVNIKALPSG